MLQETILQAAGVTTRLLRNDPAHDTSILFLHGAIPGVTPYCGGAHIWGGSLDMFAGHANIVALDLLSSGGTGHAAKGGRITIDDMIEHVLDVIEQLDLPNLHIVGHGLGGLIGLSLAVKVPAKMNSLSVVSSIEASPTGDSLDDLVLLDPLQPIWSRASQRWAIDRLSCTAHHIDDALLDACAAAADMPGAVAARDAMATPLAQAYFTQSINRAKGRLWARTLAAGVEVPVQVMVAAQDPLNTPAHGLALMQTIGRSQPLAQFQLVDKCGTFIFREKPAQFFRLIEGFRRGIAETTDAYRYA